jgi:hypothetical protein
MRLCHKRIEVVDFCWVSCKIEVVFNINNTELDFANTVLILVIREEIISSEVSAMGQLTSQRQIIAQN